MNTAANTPTIAGLAGYDLGTRSVSYTEHDAILYAILVGAREHELDLVYERDLRVLPTYGLALGLWAVEAAGGLGAYDPMRSLHAAQRLTVHAPLPASGTLECAGRIAAVWDKGKAAVIDIAVTCPQFTATYSIFAPGYGGWGGDRGPSAPRSEPVETWQRRYRTEERLAALYRLTGDRHPVHIDPATATEYGFARPILHGLCTLGIAVREVAIASAAHPGDLTELSVRLAAPVTPGDTVRVAGDTQDDRVSFAAYVGDTAVLRDGVARFGGTSHTR